jgi:hypothetical protein
MTATAHEPRRIAATRQRSRVLTFQHDGASFDSGTLKFNFGGTPVAERGAWVEDSLI